MCFNAPVSLGAFLSGTIVSVAVGVYAMRKKDLMLAVLSFCWIWVIFMQWWEYMIWKQWKVAIATRMAYIFNVMQIPVLCLVFLPITKASRLSQWIAVILLLLYLCIILDPIQDENIKVLTTCGHLEYQWWDHHSYRTIAYLMGLCAMFLLLIRPLSWSIACVSTLMILLTISSIFYSPNVASMWCFFAVFFPILALGLRSSFA